MAKDKTYILEAKCPGCGSPLRYDPIEKAAVCDHCGNVMKDKKDDKPANLGNRIEGFDFRKLSDKVDIPDPDNLPIYVCVSCAAEIIARPEEFSLTCPYCSNNIVLTDKTTGNLRPDGIVPFEITADNLADTMKKFYSDKRFLPKNFISQAKMSKITGVYVPFWVFNGDIDGEFSFVGTKSSTHRDGDYRVTNTSFYAVEWAQKCGYDGLPVDVSDRLDDDIMDSIQPFDMTKLKDFDPMYLAGFTADRYDTPKADTEKRVKDRMVKTTAEECRSEAGRGYESISFSGSRTTADLDAKYVLLPVYVFTLDYLGEKFDFAMNGQTGRLVGRVPTDKKRRRGFTWAINGIIAAVFMGLIFAGYMTGM